MSKPREILKGLIGSGRVVAIRNAAMPLRLAPLQQAIRNRGWWYDDFAMTDDQAATHYADDGVRDRFSRTVVRFFHQYKIDFLLKTLGSQCIAESQFVEIGDSDGLVLKALGKTGLSITDDPRCARQVEANGGHATVGLGEKIDLPDKSVDIAMTFETLEHSLNPVAFLSEMCRVARAKVVISIPGVSRTIIHPRVKGLRVGEAHFFEFCKDDFLRVCTHLPLRLASHHKMKVFASPRNPIHWLFYKAHWNRELFNGCLRAFDFYVFDVKHEDQGVDFHESVALY